MGVTVTTAAPTSLLTTRARVLQEVEVSTVADQTLVDRMIQAASAAIVRYTHREFQRDAVTELLPGFGDIHLQLKRTPIAAVSSVTVSDSALATTDYSIAEKNRGWLYRRDGWSWTTQAWPGLSGSWRFLDIGTPLPRQEEPTISVAYTAGYILPSQYVIDATTLSVDGADDSFNDSGNGFPALLKAGDFVETRGFGTAVNNGRFLVTGTPTVGKIVVDAALTTEVAGAQASVLFPEPTGLPFDVEKAAVEAVKTWFINRSDDSAIIEKAAGPMRLRYSENRATEGQGLPPVCVGLLAPWVRAA